MTYRGLPIVDGAPACPFVALEDDRDGRSLAPDHRHRCYAEAHPAPRALAHQEAYCLSSAFPVCPTFQDWARREAAALRTPAPDTRRPREDPPQNRPLPRREPESRRPRPETPDSASAGRQQHRDWAAPPPWAAGRDEPPADGDPEERRSFLAARERDLDERRDLSSRGLAGSPADRVAGPDRSLPPPTTPEAPRRTRPVPPPEPDGDDDAIGWLATPPVRPAPRPAERGPIGRVVPRGPDRGERPDPGDLPGLGDRPERRVRPDRRAPITWPDPPKVTDEPDDDDAPDRSERPDRSDRGDRTELSGRPSQVSRREPRRRNEDEVAAELFGPAWERPHRFEAYPSLRTRVGLPALPGVLLAAVALVLAGALLFLGGPMLLGLVGKPSAAPSQSSIASPSASVEPTPTPAPTPQTYIIVQGDSLSRIAAKFGVSMDALLAANPQIKDPNRITVGDAITIPSTVPTEVPNQVSGSASPAASGASAAP